MTTAGRQHQFRIGMGFAGAIALMVSIVLPTCAMAADRIPNEVAVFTALDKVTARTREVPIALGKTEKFGSLRITPRACYTRPPTERPRTTTFVEIDEIQLDGKMKRVFTGWMFAESPGINPLEHPVFDVWLQSCAKPVGGATAQRNGDDDAPRPRARRRVRR